MTFGKIVKMQESLFRTAKKKKKYLSSCQGQVILVDSIKGLRVGGQEQEVALQEQGGKIGATCESL